MHTDPLAYFITWTCYGTWLPGDERGWTKWQKGDQIPQPMLADWCKDQMVEESIFLDETQRKIVEKVVEEHCKFRGWQLHAVNCRSNHCHVVVTAIEYDGEVVRDQFKAWATRRLKANQKKRQRQGFFPLDAKLREHWWTRKGSVRYMYEDESVDAATQYTIEAQDAGGSKLG